MKSAILGLALLGLLGTTESANAGENTPAVRVQTVGVARPWRGWGVYRPYGAPVGYNAYYGGYGAYGGYGYRPYYNNYYRPYAGYRYYGGYSPYYSYGYGYY
jgi:hypothetical protein